MHIITKFLSILICFIKQKLELDVVQRDSFIIQVFWLKSTYIFKSRLERNTHSVAIALSFEQLEPYTLYQNWFASPENLLNLKLIIFFNLFVNMVFE